MKAFALAVILILIPSAADAKSKCVLGVFCPPPTRHVQPHHSVSKSDPFCAGVKEAYLKSKTDDPGKFSLAFPPKKREQVVGCLK